jgi:ABC-type transport system involved in multi-copper enzyme maturation permease subunit
MFLLENPVLQRELLVNLRMVRAFVLLLVYIALLGAVVYVAWPSQEKIDPSRRSEEAQRLVNLFFLSQYVIISLMAPSFTAGTITGEKERQTYEMLLASPMRPAAIVLGKLLAALAHLAVLVFASLPIVMLCLPLGGVSPYEVLATYVAMAASVLLFGMICIAASSYFTRTIASLVVSYLVILPLALLGVLFYSIPKGPGWLVMMGAIIPAICLSGSFALFTSTSRRLLHPPDVGAEAKDVVDPDLEQKAAVGMVIRSDQFPDKLFAPPKRNDLMADHLNPVYDKEMRSELFGQGTLMLRLVIQLSMFLALPLMAVCLYMKPGWAPWYVSYVVLFNMLVGPVFSAGSITSERERQTLELLLTTTVSPWQILSGKLVSGLRVSCVLTSFLVWPLLLAWLLPPWTYLSDSFTMVWYLAIIVVTSLTTTTLALFCSVIFRKTSVSMMTTYLVLALLFAAPVAVKVFADMLLPAVAAGHRESGADPRTLIQYGTFTSPLAAAFSLPLNAGSVNADSPSASGMQERRPVGAAPGAQPAGALPRWMYTVVVFVNFYALLDVALLGSIVWLFNVRWRVRA